MNIKDKVFLNNLNLNIFFVNYSNSIDKIFQKYLK